MPTSGAAPCQCFSPGAKRQVGRFLVVHVPKSTGQPVQQAHGAAGIFVMRGLRLQQIELLVEAHEARITGNEGYFLSVNSELPAAVAFGDWLLETIKVSQISRASE